MTAFFASLPIIIPLMLWMFVRDLGCRVSLLEAGSKPDVSFIVAIIMAGITPLAGNAQSAGSKEHVGRCSLSLLEALQSTSSRQYQRSVNTAVRGHWCTRPEFALDMMQPW